MPSEDAFLGAVSESRPMDCKAGETSDSLHRLRSTGDRHHGTRLEESRSTSAGILRKDTEWP